MEPSTTGRDTPVDTVMSDAAATRTAPATTSPAPAASASTTDTAEKREHDGDQSMESPRDAAEHPRWHRDEHARFMQALETFGGDRTSDAWHKIAAFVQTRSLEEVRTHGQQYLHHLVQIHHLQQQHSQHLQQQQNRILQLSRVGAGPGGVDPLQFPLTESREMSLGGNQNDLNGPNSGANPASARGKASGAKTGISPLSAAAQSVANAMNAHILVRSSDAQPILTHKPSTTPATARGKIKTWTFQEDKVLETTLAAWQRGKPYSWPKIAATLPGKTAKDVRLRYEQLVEDLASIDKGSGVQHVTAPPPLPPKIPAPATTSTLSSASGRPPPHSGLSSRIAPPPPIQVPPPSTRAKTDSPGIFPGSARGRFAITPSFGGASGMLSPTFLDFLASEDKPPMPAFAGLTDLPSPLLPSPMGMDLNTPSGARSRRSLVTPRGAATPRIWHEFLADDFKFDAKGPSPSASRPPTAPATSSSDAAGDCSSATIDESTRRSDGINKRE